jgi:hypothetical protein
MLGTVGEAGVCYRISRIFRINHAVVKSTPRGGNPTYFDYQKNELVNVRIRDICCMWWLMYKG